MPLDTHQYLVGQGWSGSGTGLRQGAIARPIAVTQKKTLAGLGKDRDEAFPFWDHLFSAASKSIQIKLDSDDSDAGSDSESTPAAQDLKRTSTGILSNRRPATGTLADPDSGATTPNLESSDAATARFSLLVTAKREAARKGLYARFYRGPVLGPGSSEITQVVEVVEVVAERLEVDERPPKKKRKVVLEEEKEVRRERRRLKRAAKEEKRAAKEAKAKVVAVSEAKDKPKKKKRKHDVESTPAAEVVPKLDKERNKKRKRVEDEDDESRTMVEMDMKSSRRKEKVEPVEDKARRKEEKRRRRAEKAQ
ncbi:hypothetical protein HMN09_00964200 [Mycena chlorophos]|uniref:G-patch domain-containing protein n=1 Tax=Mycena chlorophos TaxID=658473 RepID=A0A8H6W549_MYCCL|nr:hypothetical protein HMN09_00964200 [Mycena chlorophos]